MSSDAFSVLLVFCALPRKAGAGVRGGPSRCPGVGRRRNGGARTHPANWSAFSGVTESFASILIPRRLTISSMELPGRCEVATVVSGDQPSSAPCGLGGGGRRGEECASVRAAESTRGAVWRRAKRKVRRAGAGARAR